ncbi:hypothetical protein AVEN_123249-1, partial [Araneus ventricosus]
MRFWNVVNIKRVEDRRDFPSLWNTYSQCIGFGNAATNFNCEFVSLRGRTCECPQVVLGDNGTCGCPEVVLGDNGTCGCPEVVLGDNGTCGCPEVVLGDNGTCGC